MPVLSNDLFASGFPGRILYTCSQFVISCSSQRYVNFFCTFLLHFFLNTFLTSYSI
jgi:hypothetical protein